jgi:hypothetical protein
VTIVLTMPARVLLFILDRALSCSDAEYSSLKSPYIAVQPKVDLGHGPDRNIALQRQSEGRFLDTSLNFYPERRKMMSL